MTEPVKLLIVGAGNRGNVYASYAAAHPQQANVVAVAEPREDYRLRFAQQHAIAPQNVFADWRDAASADRLADAVLICTQDPMHVDAATTFAEQGYHMLLEKPMATTEADCRRVAAAARRSGRVFAVCHVLRYTDYTQTLKKLLDTGRIGELVSIEHLEPVGYWHYAHSYVRGNWRNTASSSFMLLAKSCHDIDWLRYVAGSPCRRLSSFGSLTHFTPANRPPGAAERCVHCPVEANCPFSAVRIYLRNHVERGHIGWPASVLVPHVDEASVLEALRDGPYGRCVYACDNDVVDHQVVNMEFGSGLTASFTMTAFTEMANRKTRLFGTRGVIEGDGAVLRVYDFMSDQWDSIDTRALPGAVTSGHGGGDYRLMQSFVAAVAADDPTMVLSGVVESLESHLMVFAAERARLQGTVEQVQA